AAVGARPQVHPADAGEEQERLPARRHDPAEAVDRAGRVRRPAEHLRRPDAAELAGRPHGVRRRVRRARPGSQRGDPVAGAVLPTALPKLNSALRVGLPVVQQTPTLNKNTEKVFKALDQLAQDPNTLLGLKDLSGLVRVSSPLFTYLAPFVTVCNYATYFLNG